ncbi:hypothetical protein HHK36_022450 [Tetracentron sinense]|uniref:Uncharacterized protein n=1 Tax=Tetracentron sinense TaxID=13715 RepID=A0A834YRY8_TETSI|nr:hypothetical protein HHK36_022442 [Tetracentron sinense]KAF8392108.1 hypothetical protein HHK36_022450 [Tetracentron sinense]
MEGDEEFCRQQELSQNPLDRSEYSPDNLGSISFLQVEPSLLPHALIPATQARSMSTSPSFAPSEPPQMWVVKPPLGSLLAPTPTYRGSPVSPSSSTSVKHHHQHHHHHRRHHHHHWKPGAVSPVPSVESGTQYLSVEL